MTDSRRAANHEGMLARMTARGFRSTKPRRAVIEAFVRSRRYLTARELHEKLAATRTSSGSQAIGLATVYRTLEVMREIGAATEQVQGSGEIAYLYCPIEHHHHAVCTKCHRVEDVPCASITRFENTLAHELRFTLTQHRMEFFGICRSCARR
ncbi:MAG TPA: Fur family transcriptional regulator [Candidatus Eremiobacteraceae bacterium]|nr:Fur family transcriptional regulator [Candidatus Eremiobacteraceae bacterium]